MEVKQQQIAQEKAKVHRKFIESSYTILESFRIVSMVLGLGLHYWTFPTYMNQPYFSTVWYRTSKHIWEMDKKKIMVFLIGLFLSEDS